MLLRGLATSPWSIKVWATLLGVLLYPINYYVFAPLFGWDWFPETAQPLAKIMTHLAWGLVLGVYVAIVGSRRVEDQAAP